MAISSETRKAGPYTGTGTVGVYPFSFVMHEAEYVAVYKSTDSGVTDTKLEPSEYTVALNEDQDNSPGGSVTLNAPLAEGVMLSIVSEVPYTQDLVLTNKGGFYPESINDAEDKRVIQIQQLYEAVQRCVIVPVTSLTTREELLKQLLEVASKANEYAQLAQKTYEEVLATQDEIEELQKTFESTVETASDEAIAAVEAKKTEVVTAVNDAGQEQYDRLQAIGDWAASQLGASCQEATLTISEAVASGAEVTLPVGVQYLAGKKHMRVAWNGIILPHGHLWTDIDSEDTFSGRFKILMPLSVGDQINVFIAPLGTEDFANEIARIAALEEAMADLSQRVVYKDEESA